MPMIPTVKPSISGGTALTVDDMIARCVERNTAKLPVVGPASQITAQNTERLLIPFLDHTLELIETRRNPRGQMVF